MSNRQCDLFTRLHPPRLHPHHRPFPRFQVLGGPVEPAVVVACLHYSSFCTQSFPNQTMQHRLG
jgi:hypothetical protein